MALYDYASIIILLALVFNDYYLVTSLFTLRQWLHCSRIRQWLHCSRYKSAYYLAAGGIL